MPQMVKNFDSPLNVGVNLSHLLRGTWGCWGGELSILYKGVETSPYQTHFKTLKGNLKEEAQRGQYLLAVGLNHYKWY